MDEEGSVADVQAQYPRLSYKDYVEARRTADKDRIYTSSANALGSIAATLGVGTMIAGDKRTGSAVGAGALGGLTGYHVARLANLSPGLRLLVAGIAAPAAGAAMYQIGPYK